MKKVSKSLSISSLSIFSFIVISHKEATLTRFHLQNLQSAFYVPGLRRFLKKDIPLNACLKTDGCCFFNHEIHEKIQKIREYSVLTNFVFFVYFVCFVCFVVKKADGLRTPSGKYIVRDFFGKSPNLASSETNHSSTFVSRIILIPFFQGFIKIFGHSYLPFQKSGLSSRFRSLPSMLQIIESNPASRSFKDISSARWVQLVANPVP